MKFLLLIKTKIKKINTFLAFKLAAVVYIMLINVKMPTISYVHKCENANNVMFIMLKCQHCWHFNINEHYKFHAVDLSIKKFYNLRASY